MQKGKISICIPTYNNEKTIWDTLISCSKQDYPNLEILVSDNNSKDKTKALVSYFPEVIFYKNTENMGIGPNLQNCIEKATGEFIVFLCADDMFTEPGIISEMVKLFQAYDNLGYIGRWYYQYMDGYKGAVRVHRSMDPYFSADNPSGMGFRAETLKGVKVSSKIFIEGASIVKQVLDKKWDYIIMQKDTIAVRIHPGGNTATKEIYYIDSPTLSWYGLIGYNYNFLTAFISLIQLKNWAPYKCLLREIWLFIKLRPINLCRPDFYLFTGIALFTPRCILRPFTNFYKHRISRRFLRW
jgi:glycosyltransferase involved in cell wall biosynthesis